MNFFNIFWEYAKETNIGAICSTVTHKEKNSSKFILSHIMFDRLIKSLNFRMCVQNKNMVE